MVSPSVLQPLAAAHFRLGSVTITDETPLLRLSLPKPATIESFRDAVRERDQGCVLTGRMARSGSWTGLEAAHIFPLAYEGYWNDCGFSNCITFPGATKSDGTINSQQNGILLNSTAHAFFADYCLTIDPDVRTPRSSSLRS